MLYVSSKKKASLVKQIFTLLALIRRFYVRREVQVLRAFLHVYLFVDFTKSKSVGLPQKKKINYEVAEKKSCSSGKSLRAEFLEYSKVDGFELLEKMRENFV
eukprot:snap_masked-scaffold_10-processed-gene-12.41-mRNA-1 protein AED:1.00 eAED:1.00 QI:0/-1/0/0/-1/1/1/0/101